MIGLKEFLRAILITASLAMLLSCSDSTPEEGITETPPIENSSVPKETTAATSPKKMGAYLGARDTVYPDWFKESFLDFQEDIAEASEQNKRVMVIFHQDNCPYCNELVEKNLSQKNIEDQLKQQFEVIALNMWGDREVVPIEGEHLTEKQFAAALKVQFTPTILFFNEKGQTALRLNGYLPPNKFKTALDYVAGKNEEKSSYREFVASQQTAAAKGELNSEPYFSKPPHLFNQVDINAGKAQPLAVFFEQPECLLCDTLHRESLQDNDTQTILKQFRSIQLDMWSDQTVTLPDGEQITAREWAKRLEVHYAPTVVLFDSEGKEIIRSEAFFKSFHIQSLFDYAASDDYLKEPNFQRYISARADHLREQGIDVDLWK